MGSTPELSMILRIKYSLSLNGRQGWDARSSKYSGKNAKDGAQVRKEWQTHYRCIRETMVLKAACTSAAEQVHTTGSVCFCRTSERN